MKLIKKIHKMFNKTSTKEYEHLSLKEAVRKHRTQELKEIAKKDNKNTKVLLSLHGGFLDFIVEKLCFPGLNEILTRDFYDRLASVLLQGVAGLSDMDDKVISLLKSQKESFVAEEIWFIRNKIDGFLMLKESQLRMMELQTEASEYDVKMSKLIHNVGPKKYIDKKKLQMTISRAHQALVEVEKCYLSISFKELAHQPSSTYQLYLSDFMKHLCQCRCDINKVASELIKVMKEHEDFSEELNIKKICSQAKELLELKKKNKIDKKKSIELKVSSVTNDLLKLERGEKKILRRGSYEEKQRRLSVEKMNKKSQSLSYKIIDIVEQYGSEICRIDSNIRFIQDLLHDNFKTITLITNPAYKLFSEKPIRRPKPLLFSEVIAEEETRPKEDLVEKIRQQGRPLFNSKVLEELTGSTKNRIKY